jgi:hypothetical protein
MLPSVKRKHFAFGDGTVRSRNDVQAPEPSTQGRTRLSCDIHPELRRQLKVAAAMRDQSIVQVVHEILCREFDLPDLIAQVPDIASH